MFKIYSHTIAFIIASIFFLVELPFRLASLVLLLCFFISASLFAPIVAKRKIDITEWYDWTLCFKNSLFIKVRKAYLKAFGY